MNIKITEEQRAKIAALYATDRNAARNLAVKLGLCRRYADVLACKRGVKCTAPFLRRGFKSFSNTHNDPRWEWAKQRGAVVV